MMPMETWLLGKILMLPAILIGLTVHEYAHALTADRLGDKTPKFQGRLTLNPFVHLDPFGFLMIILVGFGWAKPIQTNPGAYRNYYKDDLKVSLAGPFSNLAVALVFTVITGVVIRTGALDAIGSANLYSTIITILSEIIYINCMLFVLNIIPIPGFDGFNALRDIFPNRLNSVSEAIYRYQFIIIVVFLATPLSTYMIGAPSEMLYSTFVSLVNFII
jgi:Zn-dependent protease